MKITARQYEYLKALEAGPQTTNAVSKIVGASRHTAWKMLNRLIDKGLIQRSLGDRNAQYFLKSNIDLSTFEVGAAYKNGGQAISDEEKVFARELRESGLVGQRLADRYHERYPDRSPAGIDHVIEVIRRDGCR